MNKDKKPIKEFFQKAQKDMEKGFKKMQNDFNEFFGIEKKQSKGDLESEVDLKSEIEMPETLPEEEKIKNRTKQQVEQAPERKNWNRLFLNNLEDFKKEAQNNLSFLETQWNSLKKQAEENNKSLQRRIQANNQKIKQFFQGQQEKMKKNFENMEEEMKETKIKNRQQFLDAVGSSSQKWNKFMIDQQEKFEDNLSEYNKYSWSTTMRIILILIPLVVVFALIFSLIKDYI